MILNERIPMSILKLFSRFTISDYLNFVDKKYTKREIDVHWKRFSSYITHMIKNKGNIDASYSISNAAEIRGRLYCNTSIQGFDCMFRGLLFGNYTTDIDQCNSHPTILAWVAKKNNIDTPNLLYYIQNRQKILDELKKQGIDEPKIYILTLINSDKNKQVKNDFVKGLYNEIKKIRVKISEIAEYNDLFEEAIKMKKDNLYGSFINRVMCHYENQILMRMVDFCNNNEIEPAVLCFDGLLIYGDKYDDDKFLRNMEEYINRDFDGLNMKLAYKEHNNTITINYLKSLEEHEPENSYTSLKKWFEETQNICKIINNSVFVKITPDQDIFFFKKNDLITAYEHLSYIECDEKSGKEKKHSFINNWLKDKSIRKYDNVGVYPPPIECPSNHLNLWTPFAMEQVKVWKETDIEPILNHIRILCNNDESVFDYFVKWLAQMIQYPGVKTIIPTFQSKPGGGKNTLIDVIRKLFGEKKVFETTKPERDVWGSFNPAMVSSFFVHLSELNKKSMTDCEGSFKALITDAKLTINQKGKDQFTINSYHRFICATNDDEPINISHDDRRNFLIKSSDELKDNKLYFANFYENVIGNVDMLKSFYEYLKNIPDMDKFGLIVMPKTEYHLNLCELSVSPIERYIRDKIEITKDDFKMTNKELYEEFCDFLTENRIKYEINQVKFGVRLNNLCIKGMVNERKNSHRYRYFNIEECKKHFGIGCLITL